jgi:hypothetical protein
MTTKVELEAAVYRAHKAWEDRLNYWTGEISNSASDAKAWEAEDRADADMKSYVKALKEAEEKLAVEEKSMMTENR